MPDNLLIQQIAKEAYLKLGQEGVFCLRHESQHEGLCQMKRCYNIKEQNSQTCVSHRQNWYNHIIRFGQQSPNCEPQEPDNYFVAPHFYCVETICAPCGVVIAWTKFAKSEVLENVYPMQETRPSYVCIDKACVVLKFLINSHNWNIWKASTRFIVSDYLCCTYCNSSPLNGSAPNLVVVERDIEAFNTQACEQLNVWLGGFQSILNRMTVDNFNWTLHAMLFIHTQRVIQKQIKKQNQQIQIQSEQQGDEDGIEEDG
ncbi:hypothetical protein BDQ17DRAFT_1393126 [Cyathus striatus]|nr:hypothetical protein BDQ17DRAFT_1393126 [Cyathus striatus]